jgi:hypothetical protein
MRVFACYVVSKLQRHRCPTFGALRLRTRRVQTGRYIFIYIDLTTHMVAYWLKRCAISRKVAGLILDESLSFLNCPSPS